MKKLLTLLLMPLLTLSALGQNLDRTYKQQEEMTGGGVRGHEVFLPLLAEEKKLGKKGRLSIAQVSEFLAERGYHLWLASDIMADPDYGKMQNYIWIKRSDRPRIAEMLVSVDLDSGWVSYRGRQYAKARHGAYEGGDLWRLYNEPPAKREISQEGDYSLSFPYPPKDMRTEKDVTEILEPYWIEKEKWLKLHSYRQGNILKLIFVKNLYYDRKVEIGFQITKQGLKMCRIGEFAFPDALPVGFGRLTKPEEIEQEKQRLAVIFKLLLCHLFPPCKQSFFENELQMPHRKTDLDS